MNRPMVPQLASIAAILFTTLVFLVLLEWKLDIKYSIALHLAALFVVAMVCHGELARDRPATRYGGRPWSGT